MLFNDNVTNPKLLDKRLVHYEEKRKEMIEEAKEVSFFILFQDDILILIIFYNFQERRKII